MNEPGVSPAAGDRIIAVDAVGTVVFVVAAAVGVLGAPRVTSVVSVLLFGLGMVAMAVGLLAAIGRSRHDEISVAGLFWLAEGAPSSVRRRLMALLALQVIVSLVAASLRPFTEVAFAILVPVWGLGANAIWASRHGVFRPRR